MQPVVAVVSGKGQPVADWLRHLADQIGINSQDAQAFEIEATQTVEVEDRTERRHLGTIVIVTVGDVELPPPLLEQIERHFSAV